MRARPPTPRSPPPTPGRRRRRPRAGSLGDVAGATPEPSRTPGRTRCRRPATRSASSIGPPLGVAVRGIDRQLHLRWRRTAPRPDEHRRRSGDEVVADLDGRAVGARDPAALRLDVTAGRVAVPVRRRRRRRHRRSTRDATRAKPRARWQEATPLARRARHGRPPHGFHIRPVNFAQTRAEFRRGRPIERLGHRHADAQASEAVEAHRRIDVVEADTCDGWQLERVDLLVDDLGRRRPRRSATAATRPRTTTPRRANRRAASRAPRPTRSPDGHGGDRSGTARRPARARTRR